MKLSIHSILAASLLLATSSSINAASITVTNFTDFPSTNAISNDAGALLDGTFVGVGYFGSLNDAALQNLNPTTFASILTGGEFVQFGANVGWLGGGVFQGAPSASILAGSGFIGHNIYTLIGNAATLAASTELLVVKHTAVFGQDNPVFSANALLDANAGNGSILWGSTGKFSTDFGGGNNSNYSTLGVSASIVPEPSRMVLAGFGLMGLMFRRRRA